MAWLGVVPQQNSTGGKPRLGKTLKMGQRDIRRLLISGAMAVLQAVKGFGTPQKNWLIAMLEREPRMLVDVALANKMARGLWAMVMKQTATEPRQGWHEPNATDIKSRDLSV